MACGDALRRSVRPVSLRRNARAVCRSQIREPSRLGPRWRLGDRPTSPLAAGRRPSSWQHGARSCRADRGWSEALALYQCSRERRGSALACLARWQKRAGFAQRRGPVEIACIPQCVAGSVPASRSATRTPRRRRPFSMTMWESGPAKRRTTAHFARRAAKGVATRRRWRRQAPGWRSAQTRARPLRTRGGDSGWRAPAPRRAAPNARPRTRASG